MKVFFIDYPSVSNGLKRTYHKKLEVYCGEAEGPITPPPTKYSNQQLTYYRVQQATSIYTYNAKKELWVEKPYTKGSSTTYYRLFHDSDISSYGFYTSLEAACVAKIRLIERMAESYKKELKELAELFKRNVPDVQKPRDQLLEEHPDLFI